MRLESLAYLCGAELKNSPQINKISGFCHEAEKVKRGDLFLAKDKKGIEIALRNGAYGIMFEGWTQIRDSEIGWLKCDDLQECAKRLLRFFMIQNRTILVELSSIQKEIAQTVINSKEALFAKKCYVTTLCDFFKQEPKIVILASKSQKSELNLDTHTPTAPAVQEAKIVNMKLFESSFVLFDRYYENLKISPLFLNDALKVAKLFEENYIGYGLKAMENFGHFRPFFLNSDMSVADFGSTQKVVILEPDSSVAPAARDFLRENARWAKRLYISKSGISGFLKESRFDKIKEILYNQNFTFALVHHDNFDVYALRREKVEKRLLQGD